MLGSWVEVEAAANIALIKYWGKRDEELILPLNDSVSLSVNYLCARTRIDLVEGKDSVWINGKRVEKIAGSRFEKCFEEARRLLHSKDEKTNFSFKITSTTTFPVAAGLASSAAGFAAIAFGLGKLFDFSETEYSRIARIGSGSACRSVGEGLVHWHAGTNPKGEDCFSESLFSESHWPELRSVILVFNEQEKETGSTVGMRTTVETSFLLHHRVSNVVPKRVEEIVRAFKDHDFTALARITMADSNQFHAVCMDTFPPLRYMTDSSWEVIRLVNKFNEDGIKAAYSFDAGPNACIFLEEKNLHPFLQNVLQTFSFSSIITGTVPNLEPSFSSTSGPEIKQIIVSHVAKGPRLLSSSKTE